MRCPSCGSEIRDDLAAFCPRCATPLAAEESLATDRIDTAEEEGGGGTTELTSEADPARSPRDARPAVMRAFPVGELAVATARWFRSGGMLDAWAGAALALLAVLCIGLALVIAAKLELPDLGSGASPLVVLAWIVIVSLASLGVPVDFGDLQVSALPLGALLVAGLIIAWAARTSVARTDARSLRQRAADGAKIALPFALMCWIAALLFRYRGERDVVAADPAMALVLGAVWGALFGALGGLRAGGSWRDLIANALARLRSRSPAWYHGVVSGGVMLATVALLGAGAALLWIIAALAAGGPRADLTGGDALAAVIYLGAFSINVIIAIIAVALGASLDVGAQVTVGGRIRGPLQEFSLFQWGAGEAPWYAFLLLLIPLLACLLGGFTARRNAPGSRRMLEVVGVAALTFTSVLGLVAAIGDARLGAGLVRARGFGLIAPDAGAVFVLAFAWAAVVGAVGWKIAESQSHDGPEDPSRGA